MQNQVNGLDRHIHHSPDQLLADDEIIVIVDDDNAIREPLTFYFREHGFTVEESSSARNLRETLTCRQVALILLDINLPDADGASLIPEILATHPDVAIVMLSGVGDINVAIDCIRKGADDYITKPVQFNEILLIVRKALDKRRLILENRLYQQNLEEAHFRIRFMHQLSLKMNSVYLSTNELDEVLKAILVGITAKEGLRFNRAFLAMFDETGENLTGRLGIGPNCREEADRVWSEMQARELQFIDIVNNLPSSCDLVDGEVSRIIQSLKIPATETDHILLQAAQQRKSLNVIKGKSTVPVPENLISLLHEDSFVIVPLYSPGRTLGVIIADNYVTRKPISAGHINVLELFASQASLAIEHSHLYMDMQKKIKELEDLNRELDKNKDLLVEAERLSALGHMSAQMVHLIRNPITSIGGLSRILSRKIEDEGMKKYFNAMTKETSRLEKTLEELFGFVKELDFKKKNNLLYPVIKNSLMLVQSNLQKQNISLELELIEPDPIIRMDSRQISQMFLHLIKNSIEAMANGGKLRIGSKIEEDWALISIKDTGPGLSTFHLHKAKDPFFTTKTFGTGMGLAMVERLLTAHGGRFKLKRLDTGLEVVVKLPLADKKSANDSLGPVQK